MSDLPNHRYAYAIDLASPTAPARALAYVPPGSTVLELGPGAGSMTRMLAARHCAVTAVERDPECQTLSAPFCTELIAGNLEAPDAWMPQLEGRRFDVILACDVLEHLRDPALLLRHLPALLAPGGAFIVTIPNAAHLGIIAALLCDDFPYREKGLLDTTHLRFFTRPTLAALLNETGWIANHWEPILLAPQYSEFAAHWERTPAPLRAQLAATAPHGEVYQWLVVAQPQWSQAHTKKESWRLRLRNSWKRWWSCMTKP
ncbi:class I SAM-dependent methyltransferase [Hydrogenophilus thermoluteolus]|nr:class I SAM-dependent methyltransferase [Hydrogenophilus thermoluteolus]MBW7657749.1 class I SAM-dependent methyltransferase [Hydrogenophilus thermoluteolus]